jgi:hypothetical protein
MNVAIGKQVGGGPLESLYRLVTQMNQMSPLPENFGTQMLVAIDSVLKQGMLSVTYVLPNFKSLDTSYFVKDGFDIPLNKIAQGGLVCLAYLAGTFIIGYFFLRTREVAK